MVLKHIGLAAICLMIAACSPIGTATKITAKSVKTVGKVATAPLR